MASTITQAFLPALRSEQVRRDLDRSLVSKPQSSCSSTELHQWRPSTDVDRKLQQYPAIFQMMSMTGSYPSNVW